MSAQTHLHHALGTVWGSLPVEFEQASAGVGAERAVVSGPAVAVRTSGRVHGRVADWLKVTATGGAGDGGPSGAARRVEVLFSHLIVPMVGQSARTITLTCNIMNQSMSDPCRGRRRERGGGVAGQVSNLFPVLGSQ